MELDGVADESHADNLCIHRLVAGDRRPELETISCCIARWCQAAELSTQPNFNGPPVIIATTIYCRPRVLRLARDLRSLLAPFNAYRA